MEVVLLNNLINLLHMLCNKIKVQESVVTASRGLCKQNSISRANPSKMKQYLLLVWATQTSSRTRVMGKIREYRAKHSTTRLFGARFHAVIRCVKNALTRQLAPHPVWPVRSGQCKCPYAKRRSRSPACS